MPICPSSNFEIQTYDQNEHKFNGVHSIISLSKIKNGVFAVNRDVYESIKNHWRALYVNGKNIIYFDSFGVENIAEEIKKFIGNKSIITNIYKIQAYTIR